MIKTPQNKNNKPKKSFYIWLLNNLDMQTTLISDICNIVFSYVGNQNLTIINSQISSMYDPISCEWIKNLPNLWRDVSPKGNQANLVKIGNFIFYPWYYGNLGVLIKYDTQKNKVGYFCDFPDEISLTKLISVGNTIYFLGTMCFHLDVNNDVKDDVNNDINDVNNDVNDWEYIPGLNFESGLQLTGTAIVVHDKKIYCSGGVRIFYQTGFSGAQRKYHRTMQVYNLKTKELENKKNMNFARANHQLAVIDDYIYAIGGSYENGHRGSVERYDTTQDTWTDVSFMTVPRSSFSSAVLCGQIYVFDTQENERQVYSEKYDPKSNVWSPFSVPKIQVSQTQKVYHVI